MKRFRFTVGFTLIEMVVTLGIFLLIVSLGLANFRQGKQQDDLRYVAQELVSNIRKVQTLGMSGQVAMVCSHNNAQFCSQDLDCGVGNTCQPGSPKGGYGFYANIPASRNSTTSYELFADDSDHLRSLQDQVIPGGFIKLPTGVEIVRGQQSSLLGVNDIDIHLVFEPPKPSTWSCVGLPTSCISSQQNQELKITIRHQALNSCREIVVNGVSGQVSENAATCPPP